MSLFLYHKCTTYMYYNGADFSLKDNCSGCLSLPCTYMYVYTVVYMYIYVISTRMFSNPSMLCVHAICDRPCEKLITSQQK